MEEVQFMSAETPRGVIDEEAGWEDRATRDDEEGAGPGRTKRPSKSRLVFQDDDDTDGDTPRYSQEYLDQYEESIQNVEEGEIVRGRVLAIDDKDVLVDIGFKSEGVIPLTEFPDPSSIKVGDEIEVYLEKMENQDGLVVLSKQRADFVKVWDRVKEAAEKGEVVEGRLLRKIKGGVVVDLFGVEAFLPGSQIALRPVQNVDALLGQAYRFKIIKLNKRRRNIVVSRRVVLEEERATQKTAIMAELAKDQIREGQVKNITDFGAFVDLGGIDGLLHITDMSWGRVSHPSEVVSIGDKITVKVLSFDPERERISLGLKQLQPYPWENVDQRFSAGQRVKGKVVSITDYGAFVELEKGVEGLIYISEMSWTRHVRHPSKIVSIGDEVECVILKVDKENEKISLSLKQTETDPWDNLDQKYPIGTRISGKVRNLTNFGAFVELEEGIDGLVHISDMSWTKRVNHPSEVVKKGDKVDVEILNIDKDGRRISLGLKQTQTSPWPELEEKYQPNALVHGKVVRVLDRGVIVDMDGEVEGFVPLSQLGIDNAKRPIDHFREGDDLDLRVTRVDVANHRILLSVKAWLSDQDAAAQAEFATKFSDRPPLPPEVEASLQEKAKKKSRKEDELDEEASDATESPESSEATEPAGDPG
jgi:small subunit ribosomal protein S1